MEKITGKIKIPKEFFEQLAPKIKNVIDFKRVIEKALLENTSFLLQTFLTGAIILGSSDLHLEAQEKRIKLRARIDGLLHDILFLDSKIYLGLLSRIKLISGIKLNIEDMPQDGRFSILIEDTAEEQKREIEIRASILPAEFGEAVVLRILNPKNLINLEDLGLRENLERIFNKEIKKPNGMIVVTGPTGSGKTTTLYAFLKKIKKPEIKIITIEDPIEYHLEGISQTQVAPKKGYDFASGLRSIVRQDPDVILVGEIRDLSTAEIALQSSLTGHLVLTTLHTNNAAGTIARLTSLGAKLYNIAPAINLIVAQRLVRKICKKCAKESLINREEEKKLKETMSLLPKNIKISETFKGVKIFESVGCADCNFTGFKGRVGIFEAILIDKEMEKFILKNPSMGEFEDEARKKGMILMKEDGFLKVLDGITTIEEVERVVGE